MVKASLPQAKHKEAPATGGPGSIVGDLDESTQLDKTAFEDLLGKIDRGLRALPATAQVCVLGEVWNSCRWLGEILPPGAEGGADGLESACRLALRVVLQLCRAMAIGLQSDST